jgi:4-hydroxy-3-methylbut-2-en-1-yl diphosphate reductase
MQVILANPRGFCAGVEMAIDTLDKVLEILGSPVYAYHEIVHNEFVVSRFLKLGVVFVEKVSDVPEGATLIYSAHGVSPEVRTEAKNRKLRTVDATCPLVSKVHLEAIRFANEGYQILYIGHKGHQEVIGTMGEAPNQIQLVENVDDVDRLTFTAETKLAYLTQTTLSIDDTQKIINRLKERFPEIVGPKKDDICYATQNRQDAIKTLSSDVDLVIVLGSRNSSNSQRLVEVAKSQGVPAYLIRNVADLDLSWLKDAKKVLVTAGASAPEELVKDVIQYLKTKFKAKVLEEKTSSESVSFPLPKELRILEANLQSL